MIERELLQRSVVIVGVGELGGVFARGFLRGGRTVVPVTRDISMEEIATKIPDPALVLIAVGEAQLAQLLPTVPSKWRNRLALLQNELLPAVWQEQQISDPTVISVWFEKKPGRDAKEIIPSPIFGPRAEILIEALSSVGLTWLELADSDELLFELVLKNLYILTSNVCGLVVGGTVGELWRQQRELLEGVAAEIIRLQSALSGSDFDPDRLIAGLELAIAGDPEHICMGRSAPARLNRALVTAAQLDLQLPKLSQIRTEMEMANSDQELTG